MNARHALRRTATVLLVAAAAAFLALNIRRNWSQLGAFQWDISVPRMAMSILGLTAVLAWGVVVWKRVLRRFPHPPVHLPTLLRIWFLSNLSRYIPGKVWQFVSAAELGRNAGLSRAVLLTSMVVHVAFSLLAAVLVAVATLPTTFLRFGLAGLPATVAAAAIAIAVVHPAVLNALLRLVPHNLRRDVLVWNGRWIDGIELLALSLVSWALYGAVFALFVGAIVSIPAGAAVPLAGVNALAFVTGYLAFVAPGGLGPREAAMALLLRPFAPAGVASLVAVVSRLWMITAELLGAVLVLLGGRRSPSVALPSEAPRETGPPGP